MRENKRWRAAIGAQPRVMLKWQRAVGQNEPAALEGIEMLGPIVVEANAWGSAWLATAVITACGDEPESRCTPSSRPLEIQFREENENHHPLWPLSWLAISFADLKRNVACAGVSVNIVAWPEPVVMIGAQGTRNPVVVPNHADRKHPLCLSRRHPQLYAIADFLLGIKCRRGPYSPLPSPEKQMI
ncbi:hypothetical protein CEXT_33491 [Caerostris extrusa]|uniref:Uncharacterized protein n=1 Tax=Caerostris extrusa TaxID=172846 RepID=A0AAV4PTE2_CAEEX|nr:hypothetical protein CEXT_33491 [Caerostris extrusa]